MDFYKETVSELTRQLYHNSHQTGRAIKARQFIDRNFNEAVTLASIANAVCCSPFHLNREFKRHYGQTPTQYLKERRIAEAKRVLASSGSVADACHEAGYESLTSFSMLFRRMTGQNARAIKTARLKK